MAVSNMIEKISDANVAARHAKYERGTTFLVVFNVHIGRIPDFLKDSWEFWSDPKQID